jgi:hypothetical protein
MYGTFTIHYLLYITVAVRRVRLLRQFTQIKNKTKFSSYVYKEIQRGSGAKFYMGKGFLIIEEMRKYFIINEEAEGPF